MTIQGHQTALVTGASSGIGAAVVRQLTARGLSVHAVARREARLQALAAETDCIPHVLDLRDRHALYDKLGALEVDIVINNAGIGRGFEAIFEAKPDDIDATLTTNVLSAVHLLRAVLPGMVARGRGHVINIGSVAGLYPIISSVYGASKGAIHLLSQNLRLELKGSGIRVTEICPARVRTEFFDAAIDDPAQRDKVKETGIEELTAEDIAKAIVFALDAPSHVNVSLIELQPTNQVFGGMQLIRSGD